MSNQDFPFGYNHLGVGNAFDFPLDNEFPSDILSFEPNNSLLFNGFGLTGRSIVSHSAMSHPGLGRGRMPVLGPFFRPLVDMREGLQMNPPFPDPQSQLPFAPRLSNPALVVRNEPPVPLVRAALPQPPPQPALSGRNRKRRASEKAISELKHMRLIDLKEDDDCCIICMEAFVDIKSSTDEPKSENALQMPCGHVFGSHCLKLWLKDHSTCPTCRKEVDFVEEDERSERTVGEMNRRRNAIDRDIRRAAERIARRQLHHGQHTRDDITGEVRHQVLEVELIVQQRQRITAPRLDPAAREHGAEDVSWTHALLQPNPHYSPFLDMFPQGRDSIHEVEGPINNRHGHPTSGHPRASHFPQALPRPTMLQAYNSHPGVIHRAGPPQGNFSSENLFTHRQQPQPQQPPQSSTMPQRSQSRGQSQRQSPYFDSYPGVNLVGRAPILPNSGPIGEISDLGDALNDSPRVLRGPVSGCTRHLSGAQHNSHGVPTHIQDHQQSLQNHYQGLGGDMSYLWGSNGQLHQQQQQQLQLLRQQQQQQQQRQQQQQQQQQQLRHQTYTDSSHEVLMSHLPGPACVAGPQLAANAPHQQRQQQCAYTEMGMCQHQFSFANSSGFAAGGIAVVAPEMAQIVNLNCGHGFHRACLLSTKNRAPRVVGSAVWLCGRCGKYEPERGPVEGRQQALGQAQQTAG